MKILAIAEFDAAGVLHGHRRVLRALGVDYRIAVVNTYRSDLLDYDWFDIDHSIELRDFAASADILQFHPGIGQPWSYQSLQPNFQDGENERLFGIDWTQFKGRRVSLFHGSRNTARNAYAYASYWRGRGHAIWATTLDYVHRMGATYAKPALDILRIGHPSPLRKDDDPLIITHAPTDPENCHTSDFLSLCNRLGITTELIQRKPWIETIERKRKCNTGFDHLRGAFSVNTLENCALGLVPLVGVKPEYRKHLEMDADLFSFYSLEGLEQRMRILIDDVDYTRYLQARSLDFFCDQFHPERVGGELLRHYAAL